MDRLRPFMVTSLAGLLLGFLAILPRVFGVADGHPWPQVHQDLLVYGALLPWLLGLVHHVLSAYGRATVPAGDLRRIAIVLFAGAVVTALAGLLPDPHWVRTAGFVVLLAAAGMETGRYLRHAPAKGTLARTDDPLTKGDDACFTQLRFAHYFLPLGLLFLVLGAAFSGTWADRFTLAGTHTLLVGAGLPMLYGISHLLVPRFSGVPAIAAGAIKGELHSNLLGVVGLILGFLTGQKGWLLGLGPFVFLGFFTFMGVLGANIMKNKSRTQRVTREFVYVPWTFAGVFWLIAGVLMGIFLNVVPDILADQADSLRFLHIHAALLGGAGLLVLGWNYRLFAWWAGRDPPAFQASKWSFYLLNVAIVLLGAGHLRGGVQDRVFHSGVLLVALGLGLYFLSLRTVLPGTPVSKVRGAPRP